MRPKAKQFVIGSQACLTFLLGLLVSFFDAPDLLGRATAGPFSRS